MTDEELYGKDGVRFPGFRGTWYRVDREEIDGVVFELYESEIWGDEAAGIIATEDGQLVHPEAWNGLEDLHESLGVDIWVENGKVRVDPELWKLWGLKEDNRPKGGES